MIFASFLAFSASGAAQETSTPKFEIGLNAVDSGSQHDAASAFNSTNDIPPYTTGTLIQVGPFVRV